MWFRHHFNPRFFWCIGVSCPESSDISRVRLHITHYTLHNIITILLFIAKYRSSKIHSRREKRVVKGSEISEYIILPSSESHTSGVGVECFPRNTPSSLRSQFTNLHPASIYVAFAAEKCVPSFTVGKCFPPFSIQHDNISP